jgi:hypothetical protein
MWLCFFLTDASKSEGGKTTRVLAYKLQTVAVGPNALLCLQKSLAFQNLGDTVKGLWLRGSAYARESSCYYNELHI